MTDGTIRIAPGEKVAVLGSFQSGKSTLARQLALADESIAVYDTVHEWGRDGVIVRDAAALGLAVQKGFRRVIFQPPKGREGDRDTLEMFVRVAGKSRRRRLWIDEAHVFFENDPRCPPELSHFQRFGHKPAYGVNGLGIITHRTADIPKILLMGHHMFLFHDALPQDVKYLKQFVGDVAEEVPTLPPHHFIHCTLGANGSVRRFGPLQGVG